MVGEDALLSSAQDYDRKVRDFFRWVDAHVEEILASPAYQRLKEEDSVFEPSAGELDPLIRPAVQALNRIPGVTTRFSCQGVSGKVRFGERELLVVSPHEEYAYVSFSELGQQARNAIAALLPSFPGVTDAAHFQLTAGIPTVAAFGPGLLPRAHSPNERLDVAGAAKASRIYALAALRYLSEPGPG